jgi:fructoselysine-6-P-deglycase FrlB-like protein
MSKFSDELRSQPDMWLQAVGTLAEHTPLLPVTGARVAYVGCGTSAHVAEMVAAYREASGQGESDGFVASEMPLARHYDRIVVISRSGETTEDLHLVNALPPGAPLVLVTATEQSPLSALVKDRVVLPWADEAAFPQTRFATTALALLLGQLGWDVSKSASHARQLLGMGPVPGLDKAAEFVFLGRGPGLGAAREAALKVGEILAVPAQAHSTLEFRHGPVAAVGRHSVVWTMSPADSAHLADRHVIPVIQETGAQLVNCSGDSLAELVRVHKTIAELAEQRGIDTDAPRMRFRAVTFVDV